MSDRNFELLLTLYRASEFQGQREASLTIETEAQLNALITCLEDIREFAVTLVDGDSADLAVGSVVALQFGDPRMGTGILADGLADLLLSPKHRVREPKNYFLIDEKFAKADAAVPINVLHYRKVLELIDLLKKAAAYLDAEAGTLVFVHGGKFELPAIYGVDDLIRIDAGSLDKLLAFVGDDAYNVQKLGIVEGAVRNIVESRDRSNRFQQLLHELPELETKANDGYRLFISNFSYDDVRDSLEAAKVDYATKIHKAFSDIQSQILGIPVATIVVASQMKTATGMGYEFWLNSAVLIGVWVFALLMAFVLSNQFHTLSVLADEIRRQRAQIKKDYREIANRFTGVFDFLEKRLRLQRAALFTVAAVLLVGLVLAHVVYLKLTVPAQDWVHSLDAYEHIRSLIPGARSGSES